MAESSNIEGGIDPKVLTQKIHSTFSQQEIEYLIGLGQDGLVSLLTPRKDLPETEKPNTKELIQKHLLAVRYHVFQQIDVRTSRASSGESFKEPYIDRDWVAGRGRDGTGNPPFMNHLLSTKKDEEILKYTYKKPGESPQFTTSTGDLVELGVVAVIKVNLKGGFGVLIHGGFSSESNPDNDYSKRRGGRTTRDNQILFKFDNQEAASVFYDSFDSNPYRRGNPEGVEGNTQIIEDSMRTVLDSNTYRSLESCLYLGLEVKKF